MAASKQESQDFASSLVLFFRQEAAVDKQAEVRNVPAK